MYFSKNYLIYVIFKIICILCVSGTDINEVHRSKRQLLFPNSTLLQFNAGVGTPSPAKNINFNFAFQANFQLPWNRTQIPTDILNVYSGYDGTSRKKRDGYENDAKLFHFYKYAEDILYRFTHGCQCQNWTKLKWDYTGCTSFQIKKNHRNRFTQSKVTSFGHDGHSCVKQALCQVGTQPLHSNDDEDLLHELASFVLNPTNDAEPDIQITEQHDAYPYIQAHKHGKDRLNCVELYKGCKFSLIEMFSQVQHGS